jgi:hypothetical protein
MRLPRISGETRKRIIDTAYEIGADYSPAAYMAAGALSALASGAIEEPVLHAGAEFTAVYLGFKGLYRLEDGRYSKGKGAPLAPIEAALISGAGKAIDGYNRLAEKFNA